MSQQSPIRQANDLTYQSYPYHSYNGPPAEITRDLVSVVKRLRCDCAANPPYKENRYLNYFSGSRMYL